MSDTPADFGDGKDEGALRTIGEVAAATGIKPHVLRYWEGQFASLKPLKRAGGRRLYRPEDVAMVRRIDRLVSREGYTLKGARAVLAGAVEAVPPQGAAQSRSPSSDVAETMAERLRAIRADLAAALAG